MGYLGAWQKAVDKRFTTLGAFTFNCLLEEDDPEEASGLRSLGSCCTGAPTFMRAVAAAKGAQSCSLQPEPVLMH